nr:DUF4274 domain-containing protein [Burkholderia cenocepacia]
MWDIVRTWLEGATPEQWHRFAARSNYDGNGRALRWLLDNRNVDRATALLIDLLESRRRVVRAVCGRKRRVVSTGYVPVAARDRATLRGRLLRRSRNLVRSARLRWRGAERLSGRTGRAARAGTDAAADRRPRVRRSRRSGRL